MKYILESEIFEQLAISVLGGLIVLVLSYVLKKLYRSVLKRQLTNAHTWMRARTRRNRAKRLWVIKHLRRDPAEVARLSIKSSSYFILFLLSIAFYVALLAFLTAQQAIPETFTGKLALGIPMFFFEILWLINHMAAEELAKQRRKLFYKPKKST